MSGWSWDPVAELLREYHCLIPDLPEHGRSLATGPFSIQMAVELIAHLIREKAHGGRAHLIGLSLGGQIALELLSSRAASVDSALLSGTLVRPISGIKALRILLHAYMPFRNLNWLVRLNQRYYGIPDRYQAQFKDDTRRITARSLGRILEANMSYRLPGNLAKVEVPTLVIVGGREQGIMKQSVRDIVAALPRAEGRIAEGLSHNWPLQSPALCAQTIRAWISGQRLPERMRPLE